MYGFESVPDMLKEEFGGLCAYCGRSSNTLIDVDHILPHADFLFDSYLNVLPACPKCNSLDIIRITSDNADAIKNMQPANAPRTPVTPGKSELLN